MPQRLRPRSRWNSAAFLARLGSTMRGAVAPASVVTVVVLSSCRQVPPEFDLIVRGGMLLDGTGAPAVRADVGVKGDRIAVIGDLATRTAATSLDATGRVVAPGFIDTQGQSGRTLLEDG